MIVIAGAGGHAVSVFVAMSQNGLHVDYFYDDSNLKKSELCGIPVLDSLITPQCPEEYIDVYIAIGCGSVRNEIHNRLCHKYLPIRFPSFVHHSAIVAGSAVIGDGVVVMPFAYVGPNCVIGNLSLLNTRATLEHDSEVGYCSSLSPGVVTGGNVRIGDLTAVSIGSVISRCVNVGSHSVIGAASYVHNDIPDRVLVYGTPARVVRSL